MTVAAIVAAPLTKPLGGAAAGLIALLGGGLVLARRHKSRVQA
jgi:LPXTG-motif cell wall-anchored protein